MLVTFLLLMLEVPGASVGNVILREALQVVGVVGKVDVGAGVGERIEEKRLTRTKGVVKTPTAIPATETSTALKDTTRTAATVVARSATEWCDAPDRCVVFVAEMAIQSKSVPTSLLSLRVKLTRVTATGARFSAEKNKRPSSAMYKASFSARLMRGVV